MKKYIFALALIGLFGLAAVAQSPMIGSWRGALQTPMGKLQLVLHLKHNQDRWTATLDSPTQGAYGIPVDALSVRGDSLSLGVSPLGLKYEAVRSGDELLGQFAQGGFSTQLQFAREVKAPAPVVASLPYIERELTIGGHPQGISLVGTLTLPKQRVGRLPIVVLITGSGPQNRDEELFGHKPFAVLADALARAGYAVFRYDDRGVDKSTGKYVEALLDDLILDAESVYKGIAEVEEVDPRRIVLLGHSEGGYLAASVASRNSMVSGVVSLAAPTEPFRELLLKQMDRATELMGLTAEQQAQNRAVNEQIYALAADDKLSMQDLSVRVEELVRQQAGRSGLLQPSQIDAFVKQTVGQVATPWFRQFVKTDPAATWQAVRCPIIGIYGSLDMQVFPSNASRLEELVPSARARVFEGLNHLMQRAKTGSPMEYGQIKTTIEPEVIAWLIDRLQEISPIQM